MMKSVVSIDNLDVAYRVSGSNKASVILLHGWGCSSDTVKSICDAICDRFTVYSLDLPGFGDSSEPPIAWSTDDYCKMLEKFTSLLEIDTPTLIGHSFGGKVSIVYASRNRVSRVVLVGSAGIKPHHSLKYHIKVKGYKIAKRVLPVLLGRKKGQQVIDSYRKQNASADYNTSSAIMQATLVKVINEDLRAYMREIDAPTLLMWGVKDSATPVRDAHIMEKCIKNSGLVLFDSAGHYSFLDEPYKFSIVLNKFLD